MASAELRIINRRIKSVKSTKKITRAMELIASSRIVKAQNRMESSNSYVDVLNQIVVDLVGKGGLDEDAEENKSNKAVIIVVTSDRGLAGAYNTNILKAAENKQAELLGENKEVELVTVGKKGTGYFNYRNFESVNQYEGVTDEPKFDDAFEVMKPVIEAYNKGEVSEVYILYTQYMSALTQKATVKQLLPVVSDTEESTEEAGETSGGYSFEPSPEEVLEDLIPKYMLSLIHI